ncbi:MAG: glutathione S-transferase family protein [Allosphingosinicella sp.]|uniref:glutathione S-transferase family protein n=1 Tax=Allosphingosinicella sp. TaxID=2823234 RepID=UPI003945FAFD
MQLFYHPASTTCRPIMLFAADHGLAIDYVEVDLWTGAHQRPDFASLNPNKAVPVLVDGDFILTECSAILKYLADLVDSAAYPRDLRQRARVNAAMDWFNTNFCHEFGHAFVYPQVLPNHALADSAANELLVAFGRAHAEERFAVLDRQIRANGGDYLLGRDISLADYLGAAYCVLGELVGFDFAPWPNVARWLRTMREGRHWDEVHAAFYGWRSATRAEMVPELIAIPA